MSRDLHGEMICHYLSDLRTITGSFISVGTVKHWVYRDVGGKINHRYTLFEVVWNDHAERYEAHYVDDDFWNKGD